MPSAPVEFLQRIGQRLAGMFNHETTGLHGEIRGVSRPVAEQGRGVPLADDDIGAQIARAGTDRESTGVGGSAGRGGRTPDMPRMRPLGELVDGAYRGELNAKQLTKAFRGLEGRYGPRGSHGPFDLQVASARFEGRTIQLPNGRVQTGGIIVEARVSTRSGMHAGELTYEFHRAPNGDLVVRNIRTKLRAKYRGQGFSTAFSEASENYFRRSGVDRIELHAGLEDGGAVWAKAGFDWDTSAGRFATSLRNISDRIDFLLKDESRPLTAGDAAQLTAMKARLSGAAPGIPSPRELVMLTGDNPKLGDLLMRGASWHGMKML